MAKQAGAVRPKRKPGKRQPRRDRIGWIAAAGVAGAWMLTSFAPWQGLFFSPAPVEVDRPLGLAAKEDRSARPNPEAPAQSRLAAQQPKNNSVPPRSALRERDARAVPMPKDRPVTRQPAAGPSVAAPTAKIGLAAGLPLRAFPFTTAAVVGHVADMRQVQILRGEGDWKRVKVATSGTLGWLQLRQLPERSASVQRDRKIQVPAVPLVDEANLSVR